MDTDTKTCEECGCKMLWCAAHKLYHHEDEYIMECKETEPYLDADNYEESNGII
ncbi:hypothetical protein LCGC14_3057090 [marine sediment metagenome]|uniref:Uncharacterized protein n=1 Tax=marine sediment metagenome TaxID=412755 RepID=A0A0F8X890_9ZZZZ